MQTATTDGSARRIEHTVAAWANDRPKITGYPYSHSQMFAFYRADLIEKLNAIKAELGDQLICHPDYRFNPLHSLNPEIYHAAGVEYRKAIASAAQAVREMNPDWQVIQAGIQAITERH